MKINYDEFFVTPAGTVDIRYFLPGKKGEFRQTTIGKNGEVPKDILKGLKTAHARSLELWHDVQDLLEEYPYPAEAYVFGISKEVNQPQVEIKFHLSVNMELENIRCWRRKGKRWGWETPRDDHAAATCVQGAFEDRGILVGGGYQVTYYPIAVTVVSAKDAQEKLRIAHEIFEETGAGPFLIEPEPWRGDR